MKIAILPNLDKEKARQVTADIIKKLNSVKAVPVMYQKYQRQFSSLPVVFYADFQKMMEDCDVVVTIGGDGTIIHAAKHAAAARKPLLGINLGRIGFVAELEPDELGRLEDLVKGNYQVERRMMLSVSIEGKQRADHIYALNDVVVSRGSLSRMIDIHVGFHQNKMFHYRADGLVISTPTGSTAYSLSAGGPVIEPTMRCMLLTPICPHSLFSRPILFREEAALTIQAEAGTDEPAYLTIDGGSSSDGKAASIPLYQEDVVTVTASDVETELIKLKNKDFYEILHEKLSERRI